MAVGRSIEELVEFSDELMMALPFGVSSLTPDLERRFAEKVASLTDEDWHRLWAVFGLWHMPEYAEELLAS